MKLDMNMDKMQLGTFDFPKTGFWVIHAVAIAGLYLLGKKSAQH